MNARSGLRLLLLATLPLFALAPLPAAAAEQGVRPTASTADATAVMQTEVMETDVVETDAAQVARIDALLEATALPVLYDRMLRNLKDQPPDSDKEVADVLRDLIDLVPWRQIEMQWRAMSAAGLDPRQTAEIVAYYRSPSGRALVDCLTRIDGRVVESECLDDLSEAYSDAYLAFVASPGGETWVEVGGGAARSLMVDTICAGLDRDLPLRRRLSTVCAKGSPLGFCRMLASAKPGTEPALDPAVCRKVAVPDPES